MIASSLCNLASNLSEIVQIIKHSFGHDDKKWKTCGIKYKYYHCFHEYINFKDDLIEYKCSCCNKNHQHKFDEKLKQRFFNAYNLSYHSNNKFFLLMQIYGGLEKIQLIIIT